MTDTTITPAPSSADISGLDAAQKRMKNLSHRDFGGSAARQAAAIAWAGAEVGAELRENTAALSTVNAALASIAGAAVRQAEAAERSAAAADRTAQFTQLQTMLALYNTPAQMLPRVSSTSSSSSSVSRRRRGTPTSLRAAAAPKPTTAPASAATQYDEFS